MTSVQVILGPHEKDIRGGHFVSGCLQNQSPYDILCCSNKDAEARAWSKPQKVAASSEAPRPSPFYATGEGRCVNGKPTSGKHAQ